MAAFSSAGEITVAAPGVGIPVGEKRSGGLFGKRPLGGIVGRLGGLLGTAPGQNPLAPQKPAPEDFAGTSFASPYALGVAALMLKANPSLTPDQVEALLRDPRATHDIEGTTRDGAGVLDPVRAVKLARALAD